MKGWLAASLLVCESSGDLPVKAWTNRARMVKAFLLTQQKIIITTGTCAAQISFPSLAQKYYHHWNLCCTALISLPKLRNQWDVQDSRLQGGILACNRVIVQPTTKEHILFVKG